MKIYLHNISIKVLLDFFGVDYSGMVTKLELFNLLQKTLIDIKE